jgi:RimJ/RimL family protein N-acetyltransferase
MIPVTKITDGKLTLRPYESDDLPDIVEAVRESIPEIMPWMGWCHPNYGEEDAREWMETLHKDWQAGVRYTFVIADAAEGTFLGSIGFNHINPFYRLANLGYWVRTSHTGMGTATRAARMVARFGFEQIGLLRAEIVVAEDNYASLRVAAKCGAAREGVLRNRLIIREKVIPAVMHSLIPTDLELPG